MKKLIPLLIGSIIALFLFAVPGNLVNAEELTPAQPAAGSADSDDCGCQDVTPIVGIQKIKIIEKLIISKDFWTESLQAVKQGYYLTDVTKIEVIKSNQTGQILVGVPFKNRDGAVLMYVFSDGKFLGTSPM